MVKPFFATYIAEVDLVLLALILAVLDIIVHTFLGERHLKRPFLLGLMIILGFYGYLLLSNFYSSSTSYAITKSINFVPNLVFFIYAAFVSRINMRLFIKGYALVLIPLAFFFIYMKSILWTVDNTATSTFMELRNYYLAIGFHLGILFFLCLHYMKKLWLLGVVLFLLIASSARGALLFALLTFLLVEYKRFFTIRLKRKHLSLAALSLTALVPLVIVFRKQIYGLLDNAIYRFTVLFQEGGASAQGRIERMQYAITESFSSVGTSIFGHGIGSFGMEYSGVDIRSYPHNLFLELLFELGFIGLILIIALFVLVAYCAPKGNQLLLAIFLFTFFNAMKSFNLTDLWILFSIMGLILNQTTIKQPNQ